MEKNYVHFVKQIYTYCDNYQGEKVLFPAFTNLWNEEDWNINKKDLAVLTSRIISRLLNTGILMSTPKENRFETPYGLYEILPHVNLMKYNDLIERKMNLLR